MSGTPYPTVNQLVAGSSPARGANFTSPIRIPLYTGGFHRFKEELELLPSGKAALR